jgi:hypothetical protein
MRVYDFLSTKWALDDIANRRVKISEIHQLNDPFDLWCVSQSDERIRKPLLEFKSEMGKRFGLICFSKQWSNPLLWSHYADRHRGMCLGFEVDDRGLRPVDYVSDRPDLENPPTEESINRLLFTKFEDWRHEEELRNWFRLDEREGDHFFYPFDERVQLREVIAGPLCDATEEQICEALGDIADVSVIKASLAFKTFRVVRRGWHF